MPHIFGLHLTTVCERLKQVKLGSSYGKQTAIGAHENYYYVGMRGSTKRKKEKGELQGLR